MRARAPLPAHRSMAVGAARVRVFTFGDSKLSSGFCYVMRRRRWRRATIERLVCEPLDGRAWLGRREIQCQQASRPLPPLTMGAFMRCARLSDCGAHLFSGASFAADAPGGRVPRPKARALANSHMANLMRATRASAQKRKHTYCHRNNTTLTRPPRVMIKSRAAAQSRRRRRARGVHSSRLAPANGRRTGSACPSVRLRV